MFKVKVDKVEMSSQFFKETFKIGVEESKLCDFDDIGGKGGLVGL